MLRKGERGVQRALMAQRTLVFESGAEPSGILPEARDIATREELGKLLARIPSRGLLGAAQALVALLISHRLMGLQGDFVEMWLTVCLLIAIYTNL